MEDIINSLSIYDYIGLGFIFLNIALGFSGGFISIFGKVASLFTSFLGAKLLSVGATDLIYNILGGREALYTKILDVVQSQVDNGKINLENTIVNTIDNSIIPLDSLKDKLLNDTAFRLYITNESTKPIEDISFKIVETIEPTIIYVLSIALFILLFIVLRIVTISITNKLNKIIMGTKITGGLNSILGGLLGLIRGVSIVTIGYYVIFLYLTVIGDLPFIEQEVFINSKLFIWIVGISSMI